MMKKRLLQNSYTALFALAFFSLSACKELEDYIKPSQSGGTSLPKSKSTVLAYIAGMKEKGAVISGQQCGDGDNIGDYYSTFMDGLNALCGKYPVIVGGDYGWRVNDLPKINEKLISHWKAGGLVTLSWHADNPFTDGYNVRTNSVTNKGEIDLKALVKNAPASPAKTNYRNELALVANSLKALKEAGVVVIWRPFHEMNGDFFWWGINAYNNQQTNTQDYKDLWIDMYNTFTVEYGLNNLIWVYSTIPAASWNAAITAYYPGSSYVDIVGEDVYSASGSLPDYTTLQSFGKPIVLSECGPNTDTYGNYDERALIDNIKGKACYFLQWHSWTNAAVAIKDNKRYAEMMQAADVITRDEVK